MAKNSKSVQVNKVKEKDTKGVANRMEKGRLLDSRLRHDAGSNFSMNMALTLLAFLVIAVGIFVYFFFVEQPDVPVTTGDQPIDIVVPEVEDTIDTATTTEEVAGEEDQVVDVLTVVILNTPTGWLNVRTGPGTGYDQIGRVNPGEEYELVSENEDQTWYEIQLDGGTGWVIKTYAQLK